MIQPRSGARTGSIAMLLAAVVSGCGGSSAPPPTQPTPAPAPVTLTQLQVNPPEVQLDGLGQTVQLSVMALYSDGTNRDVTTEADWEIVRPDVVSIERGVLTARAVGDVGFFAKYQGRSRFGFARVVVPAELLVPVTGVVHDQYGRPVTRASLTNVTSNLYYATDASGAFDLGLAYGPIRLSIERYGYETVEPTLTAGGGPLRADITMPESPSPYVERTFEADSAPSSGGQAAVQTHRIDTRAGGPIDLLAESLACDFRTGRGTLTVRLRSGGVTFQDPTAICGARLRGTMVDSEAVLEVGASSPVRYRVTYRVPR